MRLTTILKGEHDTVKFTYEKGILQIFGHSWDQEDLNQLIAVVTLLKAEGHKLAIPTGENEEVDGMFGKYKKKKYDEEE